MKLLIGTTNENKLQEFKQIFSENNIDWELISLNNLDEQISMPVENGNTFKENATIKARYYYDLYQIPTIADDSGLCVNVLNGQPGIHSARYASNNDENSSSQDNRRKLLSEMKNQIDRDAYFACAIAYYDGKSLIIVEEHLNGKIALKEKGNNGFGYDSVFIVENMEKTLAEIMEMEKNKLSHRYKATLSLIKSLKSL